MPISPSFPPSLFERLQGTPAPAGSIIYHINPNNPYNNPAAKSFIEEDPDSPEIERAEQATIRHSYKMDALQAQIFVRAYPRGRILADSATPNPNLTRVLSSTYKQMKGEAAGVTITSEGLSFDVPPMEFELELIEQNTALEKHPFFQALRGWNLKWDNVQQMYLPVAQFARAGTPPQPPALTGFDLLQKVHQAVSNSGVTFSYDSGVTLADTMNTDKPAGDQIIVNQAKLLAYRLRQGYETYYSTGIRVRWSSYYFLPQPWNPGGYIEDPVNDVTIGGTLFPHGALPAVFWSDIGDGTITGDTPDPVTNNIFLKLSTVLNPNLYKYGISWLREADSTSFQRTWFRVTRSWVGAPLGTWDYAVYNPKLVPYNPTGQNPPIMF